MVTAIMMGASSGPLLAQPRFPSATAAAADSDLNVLRIQSFTATSLDISPDGSVLVLDVLGDLFLVPAAGGIARPLLTGPDWASEPRFSPDGQEIAFSSDRSGLRNLWVLTLGTGAVRQISFEGLQSVSEPVWDQNGDTVFGYQPVEDGGRLRECAVDTCAAQYFDWTYTVRRVAFNSRGGRARDDTTGWGGRRLDLLSFFPDPDTEGGGSIKGEHPHLSRDGREFFFVRLENGSPPPAGVNAEIAAREVDLGHDVLQGAEAVLKARDLTTDVERTILSLGYRAIVPNMSVRLQSDGARRQDALPDFCVGPDGLIYIVVNGLPSRVDPETGQFFPIPVTLEYPRPEPLPRHRHPAERDLAIQLRWPSFSEHGVVFVALSDVWFLADGAVAPTQVTGGEGFHYGPALSVDGRRMVFSRWEAGEGATLILKDLQTGIERPLSRSTGTLMNTMWSPAGDTVAFVEVVEPVRGDPVVGILKVLDLATGSERALASVGQGNDGLIRRIPPIQFSEDGEDLFYQSVGVDERLILSRISLDGAHQSEVVSLTRAAAIACGLGRVDHYVPSGGELIGIVDQTELWVARISDLSHCESGMSPKPRRVSPSGASYAQWIGPNRIGFSQGPQFSWADLGDGSVVNLRNQRVDVSIPHFREDSLAIVNARILTMDAANTVIPNGTIIVRDGRITEVGNQVSIPRGFRQIDLQGQVVMPGLIDVHTDRMNQISDAPLAFQFPRELVEAGVTTAFATAGDSVHDVVWRAELAEAGKLPGPRLYAAGIRVMAQATMPGNFRMDSPERTQDVVNWLTANGARLLKSYTMPSRHQAQWFLAGAQGAGVDVTIEGTQTLLERQLTHVMDGGLSIEHNFRISPLRDDIVQFLGARRAFLTPTILDTGIRQDTRELFRGPERGFDLFNLAAHPDDIDRLSDGTIQQIGPLLQRGDLSALENAGVVISVGMHGGPANSIVREMVALNLSGLSRDQVLRAATIDGATKLGLDDDLGSLEVGKLADLIVLAQDPRDNLRNLLDVQIVMIGGRIMVEKAPERRQRELSEPIGTINGP